MGLAAAGQNPRPGMSAGRAARPAWKSLQKEGPMRRRSVLGSCVAMAASAIALPALASSRRAIAPMTDGPFYPPRAWRERWTDWDADLTTVQRDGRTLTAGGERFGLDLQLADTGGRIVDGAEVEIWQCDAMAVYHHPRVPLLDGRHDEGFQGFGAARSSREGKLAFRTIRPVPYPGRTPHIHVKLRHPSFGEMSSQLFVADDPGNAGDFLWRGLAAADRQALAMRLQAAPAGSGLQWVAQHTLTLPA
jgi:protocatechuate 3,4-dioxygenase, beta subunit